MEHAKAHLFIAVPLPETIKQQLNQFCLNLKKDFLFKKWVFPADYHLTLKFLGGVDYDTLVRLKPLIVKVIMNMTSFSLDIEGLYTFGKTTSPRILWSGVSGDLDPLFMLQKNIEAASELLGFISENRPYTPHLTLAKNYMGNTLFDSGELGQASNHIPSPLKWEVNKVVLYQTHLRREPMYEAVEVFTFNN